MGGTSLGLLNVDVALVKPGSSVSGTGGAGGGCRRRDCGSCGNGEDDGVIRLEVVDLVSVPYTCYCYKDEYQLCGSGSCGDGGGGG